MPHPHEIDLNVLLNGFTKGYNAIARSTHRNINFNAAPHSVLLPIRFSQVISDLSSLLKSRDPSPEDDSGSIELCIQQQDESTFLENWQAGALCHGETNEKIVPSAESPGYILISRNTRITIVVPKKKINSKSNFDPDQNNNHRALIIPFYSVVKSRLKSHFRNRKNLEKAAQRKNAKQGAFLKQVNSIIDVNIDREGFSAVDLAKAMAMSSSQLFRRIKALTHMSPGRYIQFVRLEKAKELLEQGKYNVSEVAFSVGFVSCSHFTRAFQKQFGFNPSSIRQSIAK
jgi:AraC-like DNA-binding protein